MTHEIYASTSCLWSDDLEEGVPALFEAGFEGVELSASRWYPDISQKITSWRELGPLSVHNYFPRPRQDFVFNLASPEKTIIDRSVTHARNAITLAQDQAMTWVSFHSGFRVDPRPEELGKTLSPLTVTPASVASEIFFENVEMISQWGAEKGVQVLWENNVLSARNMEIFDENPLLVVTPEEIISLSRQLPSGSGILLDVSHLSVSCNTLGINRENGLFELAECYAGLHLSDDSGTIDDGALITESSWFWGGLTTSVEYIVVESNFPDKQAAHEQVTLVKRNLGNNRTYWPPRPKGAGAGEVYV